MGQEQEQEQEQTVDWYFVLGVDVFFCVVKFLMEPRRAPLSFVLADANCGHVLDAQFSYDSINVGGC